MWHDAIYPLQSLCEISELSCELHTTRKPAAHLPRAYRLARAAATLLSLAAMIRHVVFFKFKPEVSAANRTAVLNQLRALPDKIDVIRSFEVGEDVMQLARSWDAVLIATYDDLQALDIYTRHDDHVEVVLKLREICDAVGSVDFEY